MPEKQPTITQVELPTYRCTKTVHAAMVSGVSLIESPDGAAAYELQLVLPNLGTASVQVDQEWMVRRGVGGDARHGGVCKAEDLVGGFYVVYDDGYTSWSPSAAFSSGYVPMELQEPQSNAEAGLLPQAANEDLAPNELERRLQTQPAPRVSRQSIEQRIADVQYFLLPETNGPRTTICNIVLDNGYSVRGESSCVDPRNFDAEIGRTLAYNDAFRKLWGLFGFMLAEGRLGSARAKALAP